MNIDYNKLAVTSLLPTICAVFSYDSAFNKDIIGAIDGSTNKR